MTRPLIAVLPLSQMNATQKITKGQYVILCRQKNGSLFPKTFGYTEAEMSEVLDKLVEAHTAVQGKSSLSYSQEKEAIAAFDVIFGAWRDWANQSEVAYDNKVKIEKLGLDASREPQPAGAMPAPKLQQPTGQVENELNLVCGTIVGFVSIIWFVAYGEEQPADEDYRYCDAGTKLRQTLKLKGGQVAWIRAIAVGTNGTGPMGAAVKRRVL